jgi:UDP-N-acetyl-D-galactosamine dehydrogenase
VPNEKYDAIVLTVSHAEFKNLDLKLLKKEHAVVYDVKNFLNPKEVNKSL